MGLASKNSRNTSSGRIGQVDTVVKFKAQVDGEGRDGLSMAGEGTRH